MLKNLQLEIFSVMEHNYMYESSNNIENVWLNCSAESYIISANCNNTEHELNCNVHLRNFSAQCDTTNSKNVVANKDACQCSTTDHKIQMFDSTITSDSEMIRSGISHGNHSNSTPVVALGVFVILLLVLLTLVSTALGWTCWLLKKSKGTNLSSKNQIR